MSSFSVISICFFGEALGQDDRSRPKPSQYKRLTVKEVRLSGNRSFPASEIRGYLLTKPNRWFNIFRKRKLSRSNVAADVSAIERFYERRGHLFTAVNDSIVFLDAKNVAVIFFINERARSYLSGISVERGIPELNRKLDKTINRFENGKPLNGIMARSAGFILRDIYRDNGYPFAQVERRYVLTLYTSSVQVVYAVA
jgi:outer membrane protein assembly factor BamA